MPLRRFGCDALFLVVLFAIVLVSWLPRLTGPIDLRWDGSVYYVLGTSLAEGKGYRLLNEPGEIEANQYPPLLPAIVAAHQWVLGTRDPLAVGRWLRITYFIIFNVYILTVYLIARSKLPSTYALLASLVCLFSMYTYFLSDLCYPEIPYALATTLFVLCNMKEDKRLYGIMAALFAITAYALRTAGTALLAAWVCESILKKEFKKVMFRLAVSAVVVFGWAAYISSVESSQQYKQPAYEYQRADYLFYNVSYTRNIFDLKYPFTPEMGAASFRDITVRFLKNLISIPAAIGETVSTKRGHWEMELRTINRLLPVPLSNLWLVDFPLLVLGLVVLGGVAIQLARRQWIIPLYVSFSIFTLCLTPWPEQFIRYLAPLAPFLSISMFILLLRLKDLSGETLNARWKQMGTAFMVMVVVTVFMQQSITLYVSHTKFRRTVVYRGQNGERVEYRLFAYFDPHRSFDAGIDWLMSQAKERDVVASSMPHWLYLRTGLKSVMPPLELDSVEAQRMLDSVPVTYLIVDEGLDVDTRKYTSPVVLRYPNKWECVYSDSITMEGGVKRSDRFQIYRRIP